MKRRTIIAVLLAALLALAVVIPAAATEEVIATGTVYSATGTLNVRAGPGTQYEKVGILYTGDRVEIYEIQPPAGAGYGWGRIDIGWVSMQYIDLDPEPTEEPDDGYDLVIATGTTDVELNAYKSPDPSATLVNTYSPGAFLKFYAFRTIDGVEWGKTECGGWVDMTHVTLDGEPIDLSTITAKGMRDGVAWILYTDGTLSITGDSNSSNYNSGWPAGWRAYADQIKAVRFEPESVPYVTNGSLHDLPNLEKVYVGSCPFSVYGLFKGCRNFTAYEVIDQPGVRYLAQDGLLLDVERPIKLLNCPVGIKGTLQLPEGITEISDLAFVGCDQLEEVILPENLDSIGTSAFAGCTSLKTITFPASTHYLAGDLFLNCTSLETIYFEGDAPGCSTVGESPFGFYTEFRNPADTRITATAYYPADNPTWTRDAMKALGGNITWVPLGEGELPPFREGVIAVGTINSVISVNIRSGPGTSYEKIGVINNCEPVEIYDYRTVSGVKWGRIPMGWICMDYVLLDFNQPEPVEIVDSGDMNGYLLWWKLCEDGKLFYSGKSGISDPGPEYYPWHQYRDQITDAIIIGNTPYVSGSAFAGCANLTRVSLCEGLESIDSSAFSGCGALESVTIPAGVTQIQRYAFSGCTALKELTLAPGSILETIGKGAFHHSGIRSISLPDTVRTIGEDAFRNCADLATVTLRDGITSIGHYAFAECPSLTGELYLSETITDIKLTTFDEAPGFTSVIINTNAAQGIDFTGSTVLESVTYGGNMGFTGNFTFENCTALSQVIINSPLTAIGSYTFAGCTALKQVILPDTLTEINFHAFEGSGLTSIVIPDSVTKLGGSTFENCTALTRAHVGTGITTLENDVFKGCTALETASLPAVQTITYAAFSGCASLKTVELSDDLRLIGEKAFSGCRSLTRFEFPAAVTDIYGEAFANCTALTELVFTGDAPSMDPNYGNPFLNVTATAYYPADNSTWTADVMLDYGGDLTWLPQGDTPAVIYGDANADGNINSLDVIRLRQYLADWDVQIDLTACDVTGDGNVNSLDVIRLRQYLADWDVTLGK